VHRFNIPYKNAFYPLLKAAAFLFIGATNEIPAFELNSALLFAQRVFIRLKTPSVEDIQLVLVRDTTKLWKRNGRRSARQMVLQIDEYFLSCFGSAADGDIRRGFKIFSWKIYLTLSEPGAKVTQRELKMSLGGSRASFDSEKRRCLVMTQISAFHKFCSGSLAQRCHLYLDGKDARRCFADPLVHARRLLAIASEDNRAMPIQEPCQIGFECLGCIWAALVPERA